METETAADPLDQFARLLQLVEHLRGPDGCPWDRRQTPISLQKYLLEETSELIEAIDQAQSSEICDEIGDVLFILTLLIAIHREQQQFSADEVFARIMAKMIRRHPHVFGGAPVSDEDELRAQWQRIKALEKQSPPPSLP